MSKGTIYVIAAASGTGKTTLVRSLVDALDNITISISYTTRPMRPGEKNGEDYLFISEAKFAARIKKEDFLEHAKVFNHYYGTSKSWVENKLQQGIDVILEIDWQGTQQVQKLFADSVSIFILPPSMQELENRLHSRQQDKTEVIAKRLAAAHEEISHCTEFYYIVVNDEFTTAQEDLLAIVRSKRLSRDSQLAKYRVLLAELTQND